MTAGQGNQTRPHGSPWKFLRRAWLSIFGPLVPARCPGCGVMTYFLQTADNHMPGCDLADSFPPDGPYRVRQS